MSIGNYAFSSIFLLMGFKDNLKTELEYSGILIKELAVRSGVNRRTIDNYLSTHECLPSADAAVKIARVLGVSVEYLMTGHETRREKLSLNSEMRALVKLIEQLDNNDRQIVFGIVQLLKTRKEKSASDCG
jgi:transcriptional regulator with XRE-family HTH domain